jgi:hypothetical protein
MTACKHRIRFGFHQQAYLQPNENGKPTYQPSWCEDIRLKEHTWHCVRAATTDSLTRCYTPAVSQALMSLLGSIDVVQIEEALVNHVGRRDTKEYVALREYQERELAQMYLAARDGTVQLSALPPVGAAPTPVDLPVALPREGLEAAVAEPRVSLYSQHRAAVQGWMQDTVPVPAPVVPALLAANDPTNASLRLQKSIANKEATLRWLREEGEDTALLTAELIALRAHRAQLASGVKMGE